MPKIFGLQSSGSDQRRVKRRNLPIRDSLAQKGPWKDLWQKSHYLLLITTDDPLGFKPLLFFITDNLYDFEEKIGSYIIFIYTVVDIVELCRKKSSSFILLYWNKWCSSVFLPCCNLLLRKSLCVVAAGERVSRAIHIRTHIPTLRQFFRYSINPVGLAAGRCVRLSPMQSFIS